MIIALIDNGSLEPAATLNLRRVAAALTANVGVPVHPVSWKHSDRIAPADLAGTPAATLKPWMSAQLAAGERDFVFLPFFISPQGAIGSSLREDLEKLQSPAAPFRTVFTTSLASAEVIPAIIADCIRQKIQTAGLTTPPVIVVDHGGPSPASAALRNQVADQVRALLGPAIGPLVAASMEGEAHSHNLPLLAEQLSQAGFNVGEVVIALLFLSPGRHAGLGGDIAQICAAATSTQPALRCHPTELIGSHPRAVETLAHALRHTLAQPFAMSASSTPNSPVPKSLAKNEIIKTESNFLRGHILRDLADTTTGTITEDSAQLTKFHGIYAQDDRDLRNQRRRENKEKAFSFMARIRVPGGVCTPTQWLALDALADSHANGTLKITTRQAFQFHGILKGN
ncbi:MAG: CbiX/SirB N-terminal domain-containing protein, partial [Opitutaceae bacterium]